MAVAAVTRAVAGRCGENAADKGADSGWMRLDEDAAATGGQRARACAMKTAAGDQGYRQRLERRAIRERTTGGCQRQGRRCTVPWCV